MEMTRIKEMGPWLWIVAFVTIAPFICAILFLAYEVFPPDTRGTIIQGLVAVPVIFEFSTRLAHALHDMADWCYFGRPDNEKEKGRLYRYFWAISHPGRPQRDKGAVVERTLVSGLGFLSIVFILFYYVAGNWVQAANP
jgi:hypothetical protein